MECSEYLNYFRSKVICPHCDSDLLDAGVSEKQTVDYFYNECSAQFEVAQCESTYENYTCGNCNKAIPFSVVDGIEFSK